MQGMLSRHLTQDRALIFRIVHKGNMPGLLALGCQCQSATTGPTRYHEIGNQDLIARRRLREVPCAPGGPLSDYVPFYFTPFTPMMLNIKTGWNVPKRPLSEIVILVSSLHKLKEMNIEFIFSDRHAYLRTALFSKDLKDLHRIIWETLQVRDFRKGNIERSEKYQAEALVHRHFPMDALLGIICYNEEIKAEIQSEASKRGVLAKVIAQPEWYV